MQPLGNECQRSSSSNSQMEMLSPDSLLHSHKDMIYIRSPERGASFSNGVLLKTMNPQMGRSDIS